MTDQADPGVFNEDGTPHEDWQDDGPAILEGMAETTIVTTTPSHMIVSQPGRMVLSPDPRAACAQFWAALGERFDDESIERKPQQLSRGSDQPRWKCEPGTNASADGFLCGGHHGRAVHLDYVGHAGVTDRLNEVCGQGGWQWEPLAYDERGLPLFSGNTFWIKLWVRSPDGEWHWRLGVGDDDGRTNPKVMIGDAIRNAAMRFGVALYLWSKSEKAKALQPEDEPAPPPRREREEVPPQQDYRQPPAHVRVLLDEIASLDQLGKDRLAELWRNNPIVGAVKAVDLNTVQAREAQKLLEQVTKADPWAKAQEPTPFP